MFAFVNFAGGMCEYRFYEAGHQIRLERWHADTESDNEMIQDETYQPTYHHDTLRALISIADEIGGVSK